MSHNNPVFKKLSQSVPTADDSFKIEAACRDADPSIFFPSVGGHAMTAHVYCASCPVTAECLDYILTVTNDFNDWGIWAGTNANQRRALRKEKERATA